MSTAFTFDVLQYNRSQFLKPNHKFPPLSPWLQPHLGPQGVAEALPGSSKDPVRPVEKVDAEAPPNLKGLTDTLTYKIGQWQTVEIMRECYNHRNYTRFTDYKEVKPELEWLSSHVDATRLVTVDFENHFQSTTPRFLLLGTMKSRVLIIKLQDPAPLEERVEMPEEIHAFLNNHILVGCEATEMLKVDFIPYYMVSVAELSKMITRHPRCPWTNHRQALDQRCNLKHVPTLLYNENYGSFGQKDWKRLIKYYPHPHIKTLARERHPNFLYRFSWPMNKWQASYCRNDAMSPLIHAVTLTLFNLSEDKFALPERKVDKEGLQAQVILASLLPLVEKAEGAEQQAIEKALASAREIVIKSKEGPSLVSKYPDAIPDLRDEEEQDYDMEPVENTRGDEEQATELPLEGESWKESREAAKRIRSLARSNLEASLVPQATSTPHKLDSGTKESANEEMETQCSVQMDVESQKKLERGEDSERVGFSSSTESSTSRTSRRDTEVHKGNVSSDKRRSDQARLKAKLQELRAERSRRRERQKTEGGERSKNRRDRTPSPALAPGHVPSMVFVPSRDRSRSQMDYRNRRQVEGLIPGRDTSRGGERRHRGREREAEAPKVFGRLGPPPKPFGTGMSEKAVEQRLNAPKGPAFTKAKPKGDRKVEDSGLGTTELSSNIEATEQSVAEAHSVGQSGNSSHLAANEGVAEARPFATNEIPGFVIPNRFKINPCFGVRCIFCGRNDGEKHRNVKDCKAYKENVAKFGLRPHLWPPVCTYKYCAAPQTHRFLVCPALHRRCPTCEVRGHDIEFCQTRLSELEAGYTEAKRGGLLTKRKDAQWDFRPPYGLDKLWTLEHAGQKYLVDWTEEQFREFYEAPGDASTQKTEKQPQGKTPKNKVQVLGTEMTSR